MVKKKVDDEKQSWEPDVDADESQVEVISDESQVEVVSKPWKGVVAGLVIEGSTHEEPPLDSAEPTLRDIIDALAKLDAKFDQTFHGHTLSRGRFVRIRKTMRKEPK